MTAEEPNEEEAQVRSEQGGGEQLGVRSSLQRDWQGKGNSGSGQWTGLMATAVCTTGEATATGAQLVARQAGVRRPSVQISDQHPSGGPLPERTTMKKPEQNSANVMNQCV